MEKCFDKKSVLSARGSEVGAADDEASRAAAAFCRLFELVRILRAPDGCPWDREQTPRTMLPSLVEETFEAVDAIGGGDAPHAMEELGDVFLNALMISYMYSQERAFNIEEMFDALAEKLIRRHPHVFEESDGRASAPSGGAKSSGEVLSQWDRIKSDVEGRAAKSILDEVPQGFPPLLKAFKMQKKAAKKGFDWSDAASSLQKVFEELDEVQAAKTQEQVEEECGDLLFAVVNYARKLGVDVEVALNSTNKKFYDRFKFVEKKCAENNIEMKYENLAIMDGFWDEAKAIQSK